MLKWQAPFVCAIQREVQFCTIVIVRAVKHSSMKWMNVNSCVASSLRLSAQNIVCEDCTFCSHRLKTTWQELNHGATLVCVQTDSRRIMASVFADSCACETAGQMLCEINDSHLRPATDVCSCVWMSRWIYSALKSGRMTPLANWYQEDTRDAKV